MIVSQAHDARAFSISDTFVMRTARATSINRDQTPLFGRAFGKTRPVSWRRR